MLVTQCQVAPSPTKGKSSLFGTQTSLLLNIKIYLHTSHQLTHSFLKIRFILSSIGYLYVFFKLERHKNFLKDTKNF